MKLDQNAFLDEISDKSENGSCQVKNYVNKSSLRKTLCTLLRRHFQSDNHENLLRLFSFMKSLTSLKIGHVGSKLGHKVKC